MPTDEERIEGLEEDAIRSHKQIEGLEADAVRSYKRVEGMEVEATRRDERIVGLDAEAILRNQRIVELLDEVENLHQALEQRQVIEQAKGIIMGTTGCGPEAAFAVLVAHAQNENRSLWEIATEVAHDQHRESSSDS